MKKKLSETKLIKDAIANKDVSIEDIFDALNVAKDEANREFIKGWLVGITGMAAGYLIVTALEKRFLK